MTKETSTSALRDLCQLSDDAPPEGRIYLQIRDLILDLRVRPNEQLTILPLAEFLCTSSTRVREALIRLAVEQVIDHRVNIGFFTRPIDLKQMEDDYRCAFVLLHHAVSAVQSDRARCPDFSPLMQIRPEIGDLERTTWFLEMSLQAISALSNNRQFQRNISLFCMRTRPIRRIYLSDLGKRRQAIDSTRALVDQLFRDDAEGAVHNLSRQLADQMDRLPDLVVEGNMKALTAPPLSHQSLQ